MEEVTLFAAWPSPFSYRVEWALKLKGVKYEYVEEDLSNKSASLLKYNPVHKKIPVLLHGGKPIAESLVILEYIEETWPENPLLPEDPYERAKARFWAKFGDDKFTPIGVFFRSIGKEQEKAKEETLEALRILEEHGLGEKKFFGGDAIGFTDIALGWMPYWLGIFEDIVGIKMLEAHTFPRLHAWMENFKQAPIIKDNLPVRDDMFPYFKGRRDRHLSSTSNH